MEYPKFQQRIRDQIVDPAARESYGSGYGVILNYDKFTNTATVLMSHPGSDQVGEFYTGVPCPTTIGVQGVAPEPGRPCTVMFKDGTTSNPMITNFFNHTYEEVDFQRQNHAPNDLPRFMLDL